MLKNCVVFIFICIFSLPVAAKWFKNSFKVMGTQAHVEFWLDDNKTNTADTQQQVQQLIAIVQNEMRRIDEAMSPYKASSELSLINAQAGIKALQISPELFHLLQVSQKISKLSNGAFDITYASIGYQYDYRKKQRPSKNAIKKALPAIDYSAVKLDAKHSSVRFTHKNVKIDLGGIAKGYAVKRCLALLKAAGVKHALVNAGGDTGLLGDRHGRPWYVGIKHPRAENKMAVELPLINEAISTSGDYERYFIEDGVRYHHIINPQTGDSARKVVSVSIIGKDPTYVDALSTTIFVEGLVAGMKLIDSLPEFEAIIIDNQQTLHVSKGLQQQ
ncbi:MAG: FAD:protein FMN transferase [Alteromonadaceae bacterium]|nr:FAD:protein FMN transferase [Alteromonadaceae bacterium]